MILVVNCECGNEVRTDSANAGKRGRCPHCRREFVVPSEGEMVPERSRRASRPHANAPALDPHAPPGDRAPWLDNLARELPPAPSLPHLASPPHPAPPPRQAPPARASRPAEVPETASAELAPIELEAKPEKKARCAACDGQFPAPALLQVDGRRLCPACAKGKERERSLLAALPYVVVAVALVCFVGGLVWSARRATKPEPIAHVGESELEKREPKEAKTDEKARKVEPAPAPTAVPSPSSPPAPPLPPPPASAPASDSPAPAPDVPSPPPAEAMSEPVPEPSSKSPATKADEGHSPPAGPDAPAPVPPAARNDEEAAADPPAEGNADAGGEEEAASEEAPNKEAATEKDPEAKTPAEKKAAPGEKPAKKGTAPVPLSKRVDGDWFGQIEGGAPIRFRVEKGVITSLSIGTAKYAGLDNVTEFQPPPGAKGAGWKIKSGQFVIEDRKVYRAVQNGTPVRVETEFTIQGKFKDEKLAVGKIVITQLAMIPGRSNVTLEPGQSWVADREGPAGDEKKD